MVVKRISTCTLHKMQMIVIDQIPFPNSYFQIIPFLIVFSIIQQKLEHSDNIGNINVLINLKHCCIPNHLKFNLTMITQSDCKKQ